MAGGARKYGLIVSIALTVAGLMPVVGTAGELRLSSLSVSNSSISLCVECPEGFTNRLDLFSCTNLLAACWDYSSEPIPVTAGQARVWLPGVAQSGTPRFFMVGDHDLDSDRDGLSDAAEVMIHKTEPGVADSDADGVPDGAEVARETDPTVPSNRTAVIYVNSDSGDDSLDGLAMTAGPRHGPKRSLRAAEHVAYNDDVICLQGTSSFLEPMLTLGGKSVVLTMTDAAVIRP